MAKTKKAKKPKKGKKKQKPVRNWEAEIEELTADMLSDTYADPALRLIELLALDLRDAFASRLVEPQDTVESLCTLKELWVIVRERGMQVFNAKKLTEPDLRFEIIDSPTSFHLAGPFNEEIASCSAWELVQHVLDEILDTVGRLREMDIDFYRAEATEESGKPAWAWCEATRDISEPNVWYVSFTAALMSARQLFVPEVAITDD